MSNKTQGSQRECASRHKLEIKNYCVTRTKNNKNTPDLLCFTKKPLNNHREVFAVEVKSTIKKHWYPSPREKQQFINFTNWSINNKAKVFYHIWIKQNHKWTLYKHTLEQVKKLYFKKVNE